jgi:eukaryotic-like serine/threonine-protein kinase
MIRDDARLNDRGSSVLPMTEVGDSLSTSDDVRVVLPVEAVSDLDIEQSLRLLDEIWPRDVWSSNQVTRRFGRFTILGELGRGGFGVVYLAEDPLLGRRVALKVPRVEVLSGNESWRRFIREAKAASRLDHPNLIPLLEADAVGPVGYIVSAFVAGPSLEQWLNCNPDGGSPRWAARLVATLARAMDHAHRREILHRDLKPANVLLHAPECEQDEPGCRRWLGGPVESWTPRICDFGLAKLREIEADETKSRIACGSPPYMAPEQAETRQDEIGPATDVYGLGTILYELLAGRPPFTGKNDLETLRKVVSDEPEAPRKLRPGVPRELDAICLMCLEKHPKKRYPSAAKLAEDLENFLEGRPINARELPFWAPGWKWARRKPVAATLVAVTLLAIVLGLFGLVRVQATLRRHNDHLLRLDEDLKAAKRHAEQLALEAAGHRRRGTEVSRRVQSGHRVALARRAMASHDYERSIWLLDGLEPGRGDNESRGFPWSFLRRSIRDRLEVFVAHQTVPTVLAVSPDGRTLASADSSGAIWLCDLKSGKIRSLRGPRPNGIQHLLFSPDSNSLVSTSVIMGEIWLWDVRSATSRGRLATTSTSGSSSLLFSSDSKRLTAVRASLDRQVLPYETYDLTATTGQFPLARPAERSEIAAELTDRRLQSLADMLDGSPASHGQPIDDLTESWRVSPPRGVARTADKNILVIGFGDGTFAIYRESQCLRLIVGRIHKEGTALALFDPGDDFGGPEPKERARVERLASLLAGEATGPRRASTLIVRQRYSEPVAFSPDCRRLAVWNERENRLSIKHLETGHDISTYDLGRLAPLRSLVFTPDGQTLALGAVDHKIRLWHLNQADNPQVLAGHRSEEAAKEAWSLAFSPDGRTLASGGDDHKVRLWDLRTGRETAVLSGHNSLVTSVAFTPDGRTLASGSFDVKQPVIVWDVTTRIPKFLLKGHRKRVRGVAFSPDGRTLASDGDDNSTMIWDTVRGVRTHTITHPPLTLGALAFGTDGHTVGLGGGRDSIILIDVSNGGIRSIAIESEVRSLAFSPDGSHLISGHRDGLIRMWHVADSRQVQAPLTGHSDDVFGLSLSPDGRTLASAGKDTTVRLWDVITGQELLCLTDCKAQVNAVAFSPDGYTLAAADHSGAITLWRAQPQN